MPVVRNIRKRAAEYMLRRKASRLVREVGFPGLDQVSNVLLAGFVQSKADLAAFKYLADKFKERNIEVQGIMGYAPAVPEAERVSYDNVLTIVPKDLAKDPLPKDLGYKRIIQSQYDLFIDLTLGEYFPIKYLCALSKSTFKVGAAGLYRDEHCDMTIEVKENKGKMYLAEQIWHYLNMVNPK